MPLLLVWCACPCPPWCGSRVLPPPVLLPPSVSLFAPRLSFFFLPLVISLPPPPFGRCPFAQSVSVQDQSSIPVVSGAQHLVKPAGSRTIPRHSRPQSKENHNTTGGRVRRRRLRRNIDLEHRNKPASHLQRQEPTPRRAQNLHRKCSQATPAPIQRCSNRL